MFRRITSIFLAFSILLLSVILLPGAQVLALTATLPPRTLTPTPSATASCSVPTYSVTVTPSATSVKVGDQITVSAYSNVGNAVYSLYVTDNATGAAQSLTDPIFTPTSFATMKAPAQWTLTAVRAGSVSFRVSASGEVQFCSGGMLGWRSGAASGVSGNITVSTPPTLTPTVPVGNLPDLKVVSILENTYSLPIATPNASGCWPDGPKSAPGLSVKIQNIGAVAAGSFILDLNGNRVTVNGLAAGQTLVVDFKISRASRTATVDITGLIAESDETNNALTTVNNTTPTRTLVPPTVCITRTATPTVTPTATGSVSQPDLSFPSTPSWVWDPGSYDSTNGCYNHVPYLVWRVDVKNTGNAPAGSFVVSQNYFASPQSVAGLAAGQTTTLYFSFPGGAGNTAPAGQPTLVPGTANFIADYNNTVVESNENNNRASAYILVFTATPSTGPTRVFCKVSTSTPTPTPTITLTPSATPTAFVGTCPAVNASIAAPFSYDGAGSFCWQSSNLGGYINSWNLINLTVNGRSYTNVWVSTGSLPAKINGYWYVRYDGSYAWSHFEAK